MKRLIIIIFAALILLGAGWGSDKWGAKPHGFGKYGSGQYGSGGEVTPPTSTYWNTPYGDLWTETYITDNRWTETYDTEIP